MKHGGEYAYRKGKCRCAECRAAQSRRYKHRYYEFRDNSLERIAASPTHRHVLYLRSCGMTDATIAAIAGVNQTTVSDHAAGKRRLVQRRIADAILGVAAGDYPGGNRHLVDAAPARRMVAEMLAAGIHWNELATKCHITNPHRIGKARRSIQMRTHRRVATTYQYLATQGIVPASVLEEIA